MTKEEIHDEQISPLVKQIINICKEHGIAMVASFSIPDEEDEEKNELSCTSSIPDEDGAMPHSMGVACRALKGEGGIVMFTIEFGESENVCVAIPEFEVTAIHGKTFTPEDIKKSVIKNNSITESDPAYRVTMSEHEWEWTQEEQVQMAKTNVDQANSLSSFATILESMMLIPNLNPPEHLVIPLRELVAKYKKCGATEKGNLTG